jgi:hypothetical protein
LQPAQQTAYLVVDPSALAAKQEADEEDELQDRIDELTALVRQRYVL